ncbi:hypothetical protein SNA_29870 [Streptomyces natalensis ATCC 27448]|uniref:Uncharacterized protein n=1 Tax=Streptomyces natalensis ATCC 27448 TaxID=1240678 RepID=A0A0D7CG08_9ACTN|nr:hypothetical protein SNA_29870 [Streptomyces natalensis ATCC 27448]
MRPSLPPSAQQGQFLVDDAGPRLRRGSGDVPVRLPIPPDLVESERLGLPPARLGLIAAEPVEELLIQPGGLLVSFTAISADSNGCLAWACCPTRSRVSTRRRISSWSSGWSAGRAEPS